MISCSWFHPRRVFTVTGSFTASTTLRVISSSFGMFCSMPAPAPLLATFFTGQPKFRSITSGPASSTIFAASTIASMSRPYICMPTGRSVSLMVSFCIVDFTSRIKASALTNSVYTIAAPNRLHSSLNPMSVTSSIGARNTGLSPNSTLPIFIFAAKVVIFLIKCLVD